MKRPNPSEAAKAVPQIYKSQYGVIVIAEGEAHQRHLYERLREAFPGVPLKVVCV